MRHKKAAPGAPAKIMDANAAMRVKLALELHLAGHRWDDIAAQAGYGSRGSAYKAVQRELQRIVRAPAEEVLLSEIARLDKLLTVFWPKALKGDGWSADRCLRIGERRARLIGLDYAAREMPDPRQQMNTYFVGLPEGHKEGDPLPPLPPGMPAPGPNDVVYALPQSVIDAL